MRTIFVLGTGPLLEPGTTVISGQCLRTTHFVQPLLDAGHRVELMTVPIPGTTDDSLDPPIAEAVFGALRYRRLTSNAAHRILPVIRAAIEALRSDALFGINAGPACLLAELARPEPLWADLNGWTMAEGLVRAARLGHDRDYDHFWRQEAITLLRAARFSTVSDRQSDALSGELAMLGALTRERFSGDFVCTIPNAVHPAYATLERASGVPDFLADRLPADAQICLWSGGFNSWTDLELLTDAMARAFEELPRLYFVCTGGAVHGHDEKTYADFQRLAAERFPAGRCLMLGWVDFPQVLQLHAAATLGLNIDSANVETRFGARNRLTNMLGAGLPVVTTRGTEIAEWTEKNDAGVVVPAGDVTALAAALIAGARDAAEGEARAVSARAAALRDFLPANTVAPLLAWLASGPAPRPLPDPDGPAAHLRDFLLARCQMERPFRDPVLVPEPPVPVSFARRLVRRIRRITGA